MTPAKYAKAILAGVLAVILLTPTSGTDTIPPVCESMFGYQVPCNGMVAYGVGVADAVVVGLVLHSRSQPQ